MDGCFSSTIIISNVMEKQRRNKKTNKCKQCDFTSAWAPSLRRHLKSHSGERSHKCNQCDYSSVEAGDLGKHIKTHSGEKTKKCNQCDSAYVQAASLRRHLKIHSGEKSYKCKQCTIGYAMKIKKKKMFKSKHLVFAHFSTKRGDFFGIDGKIPMFCHKYFLKSKM